MDFQNFLLFYSSVFQKCILVFFNSFIKKGEKKRFMNFWQRPSNEYRCVGSCSGKVVPNGGNGAIYYKKRLWFEKLSFRDVL